MADKVLAVLTSKSRDRMMSEGGTAHWVLNPAEVRKFDHVICVRHANSPIDPGPGSRPEPHGAAFLVAKIRDLEVTKRDQGRTRYRVLFDEVADVSAPDFWDGSRNPVRYMPTAEVLASGIDLGALKFKPMPRGAVSSPDSMNIGALTIEQAKRGLAKTFSVSPDAIEIIIRG